MNLAAMLDVDAMDCTTETPRKAGRPPSTVTLTRAELAVLIGMTPKGVSKRIERGQELTTPNRYGLVKDVTNEPKRKPAGEPVVEPVDPVKQRERDIAELLRNHGNPESHADLKVLLGMAWNDGHGCGARR